MLHCTTMFLLVEDMAKIKLIAKSRGLKTAQVVRMAIHEYLAREKRKK